MTEPLVLAIDGGNWKTDLALVRGDGNVLALVRGPQSSPHHLGLEGSLAVLEELLAQRARRGRSSERRGPVAEIAQLSLAGVDFPSEERDFKPRPATAGWGSRIAVGNDTFAVLRGGTSAGGA